MLQHLIAQDLGEIWSVLSRQEKRVLAAGFQIHNYKKNQIIYAEGDEPEHLWCLLKGKVKKYKNGICDRIQILRLHRPVQFFGYRAYFARESYVSSAAAIESSVIGAVPLKVVEQLIRSNIDVAMFFIHEAQPQSGRGRHQDSKPDAKAHPRAPGRGSSPFGRELWSGR